MLFKNITMIDKNMTVRENMYLGIKDQIITYIGTEEPENAAGFGRIYPGSGKLLCPGFYNAHSHASMILLRGYAENLSLMQWLNGKIFPFEAKLNAEDIYYACLLNIAEMLRFGFVSSSDMYLNGPAVARAFAESGMKANVSQTCLWFGPENYYDLPVSRDNIELFVGFVDNDRVRPEISLHAEYTSTEKIAVQIAAEAQRLGATMHVHVAETADETEICRKRHGGRSPVRYLADCGIFDTPTVAAHCVWVDDEDIAILKEKKVTVATCPKSNLKLASGICPVSKLLKSGVNVAVGTDSVASNNNVNMLEEIRFFSLLQKGSLRDPRVITPAEALFAATRAGAIAQGRLDSGCLEVGYKADIAVFDLEQIYLQPTHNVLNNLIYAANCNDVCMTIVDGKILYENGRYPTLDLEKISFAVERSRLRILTELKEDKA